MRGATILEATLCTGNYVAYTESAGRSMSLLKNERLGLAMVVASVAVIVLITGLLFKYQRDSRLDRIHVQGVSLARLLSSMPYEQLVLATGRQGPLHVLKQSHNDPDFLYTRIVDREGNPLAEVTAPGIVVPAAPMSVEPAAWMGARELELPGDDRTIVEFYAPVLSDGNLAGHICIGYSKPGYGINYEQLPFFATLALPIFLLTPLFYSLVKRETQPLRAANAELLAFLNCGKFQRVEVDASGERGEFMQRFNRFLGVMEERVEALQSQNTDMLMSGKVLSYKKSRIEAVLQAIPDAVMILDESGSTVFANVKFKSVLGLDANEIIGTKPQQWCMNAEVRTLLSDDRRRRGEQGHRLESIEFAPRHAPKKAISASAYPLFLPKDPGHRLGTLVLFRDVTGEVLAKAARGEFVAHIAHELKTPLNVMAMYSEVLLDSAADSREVDIEAANVIHDQVERMATLINNLLSITQIEMGSINIKKQRIKLRELLMDIFDSVSPNGRSAELKFELDLPSDLPPISVDKDLMRVAINNLLTNAIKYNRPGGAVTLATEETEAQIHIRVRDTGIGIEAEDQARIFEKFFRSEEEGVRKRSGHGLGLALAKEIVHLHHGELSLQSSPGKGSEFTITFNKDAGFLQQAI